MRFQLDVKSFYTGEDVSFGEPLVGALLRIPWEDLRRRQLEGLRNCGFDDIHEAYLSVFHWPGPQGLRPSELATRRGMTRQALNHLLRQLEDAGYLTRNVHNGHGRATRIHLTRRGVALGRAMREIVAETEQEWSAHLGEDRFEQLRGLLTALAAVVAPAPSE